MAAAESLTEANVVKMFEKGMDVMREELLAQCADVVSGDNQTGVLETENELGSILSERVQKEVAENEEREKLYDKIEQEMQKSYGELR